MPLTGDGYHRRVDKFSNAEMIAAVGRLEALLPGLMRRHAPSRAMDEFTREVEMVEARVHDEDQSCFHDRVQCMLRDAGLIPGDDEPCGSSSPMPDDDAVSQ